MASCSGVLPLLLVLMHHSIGECNVRNDSGRCRVKKFEQERSIVSPQPNLKFIYFFKK